LTPASGRQDHTTSPYAPASFVRAQKKRDDAAASTASHPAFVTAAIRPSVGETAQERTDLGAKSSDFLKIRNYGMFKRRNILIAQSAAC
jgi:hypothetical protein